VVSAKFAALSSPRRPYLARESGESPEFHWAA
jgi:hypothetical protein